ncbi:hypothetical protein ACFOOK_04570 [Micromonospora krabiensis]|uniref:Polymorphic outer membrane protein repeat-containing protein n=1 Tax=Micromonospora krabiensis TaxID=307121 RepID=A0A1C3NDQ8_9ACTN|nr:hypothetical protein [Micromonospora krabiensis]SBV30734.1 hypothetical protein GA0070620_6335 [Micromonospora krabiensis]
MSNYLAKNNASEPGSTPKGRRKFWLASGVAGLTGVVSIAAVGIATGAGAVGVDALKWSTAQVTKDGDQGADRGKDDYKGKKEDRKDRDHKDRGKEVPCDSDKLIQAIIFANNNHGGVLELAKNCTYTLTRSEKGNGLPVIKEDITLKGHDTKIERAANAEYFRILNVGPGGHLTLKDLTIKNGQTLERKRESAMTAEAVWSRFSNSVEATAAAQAGKPYLPLLEAAPKAAAAAAAPEAAPQPGGDKEWKRSHDGGGLLVQSGGSADLEKTHVVGNQAGGNGGGIANYGKTSLRKTTVAHNTAFFFGGGIFNAGVLKVEESKVENNQAGIGGAGISNGAVELRLYDDTKGGTVWVEKTEITRNDTYGFGGGFLDLGGNTTVKHSKITDNDALIAGGGLAAADGQLDLKRVLVAKNTTGGVGGGLALAFGGNATVEESQVSENVAGFFGGGVFNLFSQVTFRDSEIVKNRAPGLIGIAGGIFNVRGDVDLQKTKVADNSSSYKPGGVFNYRGDVDVDDKSAIKGNKPTNCKGSPDNVPNCFG